MLFMGGSVLLLGLAGLVGVLLRYALHYQESHRVTNTLLSTNLSTNDIEMT